MRVVSLAVVGVLLVCSHPLAAEATAGSEPPLAPFKPPALANIANICLYLEDYAKGLRSIKASIESAPAASMTRRAKPSAAPPPSRNRPRS